MANESFGNIILRLLVDNKAFKEGLVTSLQLVQITSQQIKDLTEFKIPAPDVKALDLALETGEAKIRDFLATAEEIAVNPPVIPPEVPASHDEHTRKVGEGERAVREFLAQQRFQNRVVGEGRQAILGLTNAVGFLSLGNTGASGTTKVLQESMLAGIGTANGLEFALFGLGQVGAKLPGTLGAIATGAASLAGPIAAAVGVGVVLATVIDSVNAKARQLAEEGLRQYLDRIKEAGGGNVPFLEEVERSLEAQTKSLEQLKRLSETATFGGDVTAQLARADLAERLREQDEQQKKIIEELKEEIEKQQVLNEAIREANEAIKANGDEYRRTKVEVSELTAEIESGNLSEEKRRALIDERAAKQEQVRRLTLSTFDLAKEELGLLERRRALGEATTQQLIAQIDKALQGKLTEEQRLELQTRRHTLTLAAADEEIAVQRLLLDLGKGAVEDVVRALEAKRAKVTTAREELEIEQQISAEYAKQAAEAKAQVAAAEAALDKLEGFAQEAGLNAIQNRFVRAGEAEKIRHQKRLDDIEEEFDRAVENGADIDAARKAADDAREAERRQNDANSSALEISRQQEIADFRLFLLGNSTDAQIARINQAYDAERERVKQLYTDKDQQSAALAELERRRTEEVEAYQLELRLDSADRLAAALSQAANQFGDDLLGKLAQALQIAIQIQRALLAAKLGEAGGDPLSLVAAFLPIFGLFAGGGEVPGGSYVVNREASQRYKPVLDALGAAEVKGGVPGKDSVPVKIKGTDGAALMMPGERIVAPVFAPIAKAINEGRVVARATGGPLVRQNYLAGLFDAVKEYSQVNPAFSPFPVPADLVRRLQAEITLNGGFNRETMDVLIEEVRNLRSEVGEMKAEIRSQTTEVRGQTEAFKGGLSADIDNGKLFFRKHLPDALDFEKDRSA